MTSATRTPMGAEAFFKLGGGAADYVRPVQVGFCDGADGSVIGTGTLLRYRGAHLILTAGHLELRSTFEKRGIVLSTMVSKGAIRLRHSRPDDFAEVEDLDGPVRLDVGVVRIDPRDAAAISAWSNNVWFEATDLAERNLPYDENDRVFIATGFPKDLVAIEAGDNLSGTIIRSGYFLMGMHLHPTVRREGALSFSIGKVGIELESGEWVERPELRGLSGGPVWTVDLGENGNHEIRLIGTHSGSSDDVALAIHVRHHLALMRERGWA